MGEFSIQSDRPFHVMTKPTGPICNLDCSYCFYLEKEQLYPDTKHWMMRDDLLESYIRQYIEAQPVACTTVMTSQREPVLQFSSMKSRTASGSGVSRSEEHTSELQSLRHLVCRL